MLPVRFRLAGVLLALLLLAGCAAEGEGVEVQRQPLACGSSECASDGQGYFCGTATCLSAGAEACCACIQSFACGLDCRACESTGTSSNLCTGATSPASISCGPVCLVGFANPDSDDANGCEACAPGYRRVGAACSACDSPEACGGQCLDCRASPAGHLCRGGACGCDGDEDCGGGRTCFHLGGPLLPGRCLVACSGNGGCASGSCNKVLGYCAEAEVCDGVDNDGNLLIDDPTAANAACAASLPPTACATTTCLAGACVVSPAIGTACSSDCRTGATCQSDYACRGIYDPASCAVDAGTPGPDASVLVPDASVAAPDASVAAPDASLAAPDASVVLPDATVAAPDAGLAGPDASLATPDASVVLPDATIAAPDAGLDAPDAGIAADASTLAPDASDVAPDGGVPVSDASVEAPDASEEAPDAQPAADSGAIRPPVYDLGGCGCSSSSASAPGALLWSCLAFALRRLGAR